jgi:hypothetical protein
MRTRVFIPPLRAHAGGVAVLLQIAAILHQAGHDVLLAPREGQGPFPEPASSVPVHPWEALELTADDLWLVPEGWVNALAPGLRAGARCLVYCQNWAYLFSALPPDVQWGALPVRFLAVSHPVAWFMEQTTGQQAALLRPGMDLQRFHPPEQPQADVTQPLRVAFMPRKNKALVERVREIVLARRVAGLHALDLEWVEISGLPPHEVAERLRSAHMFLASGFPEGCPLPPLEAMACGCLPVGFAGFGGWDYMRHAMPDLPGAARPWWPERPVETQAAWGGNGFWCADADVLAAALALEEAARWWLTRDPRLAQILKNCQDTARAYSTERQSENVLALWNSF